MARHPQALADASIPDVTVVISRGQGNLGVANPVAIRWPAFVHRLAQPAVLPIDRAVYDVLDKKTKNRLKGSVGHFVGGKCANGKRNANAVEFRSVLTFDLDNIEDEDLIETLRMGLLPRPLHCSAVIVSTMSHTRAKPRYRIVVLLSREVLPAEYDALARLVCDLIDPGLKQTDPVSYRPSQVMYLPAHCRDDGDQFEFYYVQGPALDVDAILDDCPDWQQPGVLPRTPVEIEREAKYAIQTRSFAHRPRGTYAGDRPDPRRKPGILGAWCRAYSPQDVIEHFFPEEYEFVSGRGRETRYTRIGASGSGGIVVYDDTWIYSFHSNSDPLCGTSYHSFDFARVKLFGSLDAGLGLDMPISQRPSYIRMLDLARQDEAVLVQIQADTVTAADFNLPSPSSSPGMNSNAAGTPAASRVPSLAAFFSP